MVQAVPSGLCFRICTAAQFMQVFYMQKVFRVKLLELC